MEAFNQIFKSQTTLKMGIKLKTIIEDTFEDIEENMMGGAKVKLTLYTRGGKNNVLCGIQEGTNESCFLYVHHIDKIDHPRLKFSGKGKHAKRVKFQSLEEIIEGDIQWLLSKVNERAPY